MLVGRHEEIQTLEKAFNSKKPEFLALFGRRRIGKTFLIRQLFSQKKNTIFFNVTGLKDGTREEQLIQFNEQISQVFYDGLSLTTPKSWREAFKVLTQAIAKQSKNKKLLLFFDELPWMDTPKSRLLQNLDYYWNQHWSNDDRIKLIVCGSSASWIVKKIINNKGGLHNRITGKIRLSPFTLAETKLFLQHMGVKLNNEQILLLYMVTGGVPYYLTHIDKKWSAIQNIEKLAFSEKGLLYTEFDNLFSSLFDDYEIYIKIIRTIAEHQYGIGKRELLKAIGKSSIGEGGVSKLAALEEAGFIMSIMPFQHKRQGIYYRVIDQYSLFYLKWVAPLRRSIQEKSLVKQSHHLPQRTPAWYNWLGYAFETVCYQHLPLVRSALAISPDALASAWRYAPRKGNKERGAQIDLLFDRNDDAITICEIKYSEEPYALVKDYVQVLNRKLTVFKEQTNTKKQLFLAMITSNGLKNNFYAEDMISGVVTLDNLFGEKK